MGHADKRFTSGGVGIPPISVYAPEGTTWPDPPFRLSVRSTGHETARLRILGLGAVARAEAKRVVAGVPTGDWIDISGTDDFAILAAEGELETVDVRFVMLARAGGFVRRLARIAIVENRAVGI